MKNIIFMMIIVSLAFSANLKDLENFINKDNLTKEKIKCSQKFDEIFCFGANLRFEEVAFDSADMVFDRQILDDLEDFSFIKKAKFKNINLPGISADYVDFANSIKNEIGGIAVNVKNGNFDYDYLLSEANSTAENQNLLKILQIFDDKFNFSAKFDLKNSDKKNVKNIAIKAVFNYLGNKSELNSKLNFTHSDGNITDILSDSVVINKLNLSSNFNNYNKYLKKLKTKKNLALFDAVSNENKDLVIFIKQFLVGAKERLSKDDYAYMQEIAGFVMDIANFQELKNLQIRIKKPLKLDESFLNIQISQEHSFEQSIVNFLKSFFDIKLSNKTYQ